MIQLRNRFRRPFSVSLTHLPPIEVKEEYRRRHQTANSFQEKLVKYNLYEILTILSGEVSPPQDDEVLNNPVVKNAVQNKWLQVIPYEEAEEEVEANSYYAVEHRDSDGGL